MKYLLRSYLLLILVVAAILSILSYGYGAGYVYIYFRQWQIQTNIWILFIVLALASFIAQMIWLAFKRYFAKLQRKKEKIFNFQDLHPYEKLAVLWLLNADRDEKNMIQGIFSPSILLNEIIQSMYLRKNGQLEQALNILQASSPLAFELAEMQRIEVYLAEGSGQKALTHLEFLSQHDISPWLNDIRQGYERKLNYFWGKFAIQFPWLYLHATQFGILSTQDKTLWLQQILTDFDQASYDDLEALQQRYHTLQEHHIYQSARENKVLWLKILARLPEMSVAHEDLAEHLLNEMFDQDVFYMWFEKQLLKQQPDYLEIERHVEAWEQKYTPIPVFTFAKWHVYQATARQTEAAALLELFPDNLLMSYLRIKVQLQDHETLAQQLNLLFEGNSNFLKINI
ncbi:MAG: heme biosynthesis protein HemY [Acinetobacter sp.]